MSESYCVRFRRAQIKRRTFAQWEDARHAYNHHERAGTLEVLTRNTEERVTPTAANGYRVIGSLTKWAVSYRGIGMSQMSFATLEAAQAFRDGLGEDFVDMTRRVTEVMEETVPVGV